MTDLIHARVLDHLARLRLGHPAQRLDVALSEAARTEPTYLSFLDQVLGDEIGAKQRKRVTMGIQIAHFPAVRTRGTFEFKFQPSIDEKLVRERCTGRFIATGENVLLFGPPAVGKTHLAIAIGWAVIEDKITVLFTSATALLGALAKAQSEGQFAEKMAFYLKPKLLIVDELGYLPFEKRSAHLFFQLVARRFERASSILVTTNQVVTQWGAVFGDELRAAAILDRLLHYSHTLLIQGESYRLKQKWKAGLIGSTSKQSQPTVEEWVSFRDLRVSTLADG